MSEEDEISTGKIGTGSISTGKISTGKSRMGDSPTMAERERAAGMNLAGGDTMSGRGKEVLGYSPPDGNVDSDWDDFSPDNPGGGGGGGNVHAFQLVKEGADTLYVRKGTVNGVVPTLGGSPLSDDYLDNELSFTATGSTTFYLKAVSTGELDDEGVTSVTIETSPVTDTDDTAGQTLGSVTATGGDIDAFSSNLSGSQDVGSCGTYHEWKAI